MSEKLLYIVLAVTIISMLFNKKIRITKLLREQFQVFKNAKNGNISIFDIWCFIIAPLVISSIIVFRFDLVIDTNLANTLSVVFSIVFTILFGFSSIIIGKIESSNDTERQVVSETFVSIIFTTILSLIGTICSLLIISIVNEKVLKSLSLIIIYLSIISILFLLMIIKRTYCVYEDTRFPQKK